jgi:hypothetical protein
MQFSEIQYVLRNAVCAPPTSPALKPIKLVDLEARLQELQVIANTIRLQADETAFAGPPAASRLRAFEEVFGEDSDSESDEDTPHAKGK